MISRSAKSLFLSIILCSVILVTTTTTIISQKDKSTTRTQFGKLDNKHSNLMLIGDPVGGGGTPMGTDGNRTGNQTG
jgi:hypothetical protein